MWFRIIESVAVQSTAVRLINFKNLLSNSIICLPAYVLVSWASVENVSLDTAELENYSCEELQTAMNYVGGVKEDAEVEKGTTLANASSAVFVPFSLQINQMRASGASDKAEKALTLLYKEWDKKKCAEQIYLNNILEDGTT